MTVKTLRPPKRGGAAKTALPVTEDHLSRLAAARRQSTRRRLLETALPVFAARGVDAAVVDDFIVAAGFARGTFYNHFTTTGELLHAVVATLGDEIVALIDPLLQDLRSPAERLASGTRLYLAMAANSAVLASFITRVGTRRGALGELAERYLARDLAAGQAQGLFDFEHVGSARDLLMGCAVQSIESLHAGRASLAEVVTTLQMALRGLGLRPKEAARVCSLPLPTLQPVDGSILAQLLSLSASGHFEPLASR